MTLPFGPVPDFGEAIELLDVAPGPGELYRAVLLAETHPHYLYSTFHFAAALAIAAEVPRALSPRSADTRAVPEWILRMEGWARDDLDAAGYAGLRTADERRLLLTHFAPVALVEGCWLERATGLATAERTIGLLCQEQFRLRASGEASRALFGVRARVLALDALGRDVEAHHQGFVTDCGIGPAAFEYALAGLCLGCFPATFLPEIAGFELWHACVGSCPPLVAAGEGSAAVTGRLVRQAREIVGEAVAAPRRADADAMRRVLRGFVLAHQAYRRWRDAFEAVRARSGPTDRMLALIGSKARQAVGYHKRVEIAGSSLDTYFERGAEGCRELLPALAASAYVCPARPEWSRLLTSATRLRGPMFGVFTIEESAVIEDWIRDSAGGSLFASSDRAVLPLAGSYVPPQHPEAMAAAAEVRFGTGDAAELSFYFLNADLHPLSRAYARRVAEAQARLFTRLGRSVAAECPPYGDDALDGLAEGLRVRSAGPDETPRGLCAEYPLMCTHGSWLQGTGRAAGLHRSFNLLLFDIYREKNGGGDPAHNHNRIGRRLLGAAGAVFPPTTDRDFYDFPEAMPSFFRLCGHLALALNPLSFMPELLGLNLAVNISGPRSRTARGAAPAAASTFEALPFDLHEAADDFASGHLMASRRAIADYLDQASNPDPANIQPLWVRIWNACHATKALIDRPDDPEVRAALGDNAGAFPSVRPGPAEERARPDRLVSSGSRSRASRRASAATGSCPIERARRME